MFISSLIGVLVSELIENRTIKLSFQAGDVTRLAE